MQDGAIVHLTKDGVRKHKVPDDHSDATCAHSRISRETDVFF